MMPLLALALATAALTITICKAKVTERLRLVLFRVKFIREMMSCLYCASHWTAGVLVALTRPRIGMGSWPMDLIVSWLAAVALSSFAMFVINWSHGSMQWDSH